ncbi:MAG: hypothetical protein DMF78_19160 [Acidobacteria bacterium]|nr:MAG: hypothetical protein DMF78_19160 [Acidobacteriota bacterium]
MMEVEVSATGALGPAGEREPSLQATRPAAITAAEAAMAAPENRDFIFDMRLSFQLRHDVVWRRLDARLSGDDAATCTKT